ncbi:MAG: SurA N-terminal domain-containing protein [Alphaproteobacteria bacterium]|nr:SurA N-terminal domain-containing protein [Alphaproteobacteria bacterium]
MLRALRNQTQSIFFKIFLGFLICGFALWGVGDLTGGANNKPVLSVENKEISSEEVLQELNKLRYSLPQRPPLKDTVKNGMLQNVLNKFEQELLINKEADFLNLHVPLSVQTKAVRNENAFKNPLGKFSENKYFQSLNNAGLTEKKYLKMIQTEGNFKQLSMPFQFNYIYDNKVVKAIIDWQNEIREIEFDFMKYLDKKNIQQPDLKILNEFYSNNKDTYIFPKTRDIKYIEIKPSDFHNEVKITKKQINDKYETDKSNYITAEKREIYQITSQEKNKVDELKKLINNGTSFQTAATKIFNLSKDDINLGFLTKKELPDISAEPLFSGKKDDVIGPLKTEFGFNIYKIVNIIPKTEIKYEDIIKDVKVNLLNELSIEILYEKLDMIEDLIAEGNNLEEIVKSDIFKNKIFVKQLNKVSEDSFLHSYTKNKTFINKGEDFLKNIWMTKLNETSDIIDLKNDTYALIQVIKEKSKEQLAFEQVREKVLNQWTSIEIVNQTKAKLKKSILSKNENLKSNSTIKRNQKSLDNFSDNSLIFNIFEIDNKDINFLNTVDGVIAVKVKNRKVDNYQKNIEINNNLNLSLSKSFFNDYSNYFIRNLATKHKLVRNYIDLENFLLNTEVQ